MKRFIASLAILFVVSIAVIASVSWWRTTQGRLRSEDFQKELIDLLIAGQPVHLFSLIDERVSDATTLCLLSPYSDAKNALPPGTKLDWSWLGAVDERSMPVVALAGSGEIIEALRVDRRDLDLAPYGWGSACFDRKEDPQFIFLNFDSEKRLIATVRPSKVER
jgi:hypothetical protein